MAKYNQTCHTNAKAMKNQNNYNKNYDDNDYNNDNNNK